MNRVNRQATQLTFQFPRITRWLSRPRHEFSVGTGRASCDGLSSVFWWKILDLGSNITNIFHHRLDTFLHIQVFTASEKLCYGFCVLSLLSSSLDCQCRSTNAALLLSVSPSKGAAAEQEARHRPSRLYGNERGCGYGREIVHDSWWTVRASEETLTVKPASEIPNLKESFIVGRLISR